MTIMNTLLFKERDFSLCSSLSLFHLSLFLPLSFLGSAFVNNSLYVWVFPRIFRKRKVTCLPLGYKQGLLLRTSFADPFSLCVCLLPWDLGQGRKVAGEGGELSCYMLFPAAFKMTASYPVLVHLGAP